MRELVVAMFAQAVADALRGDTGAYTWLVEFAPDILRGADLDAVARLGIDGWLAADPAALAVALGGVALCRKCASVVCHDGRCRCERGVWVQQGRRAEYAESTVRHDSKGFLKSCVYFSPKESAMRDGLCVGANCGAGEELPMPAYDDYDGLRRWHAALGEGGGALAVQQDEQGAAVHATVKEMRAYILLHYPIWDRGLLDQMTRQQLTALYETLGGPPDVGELEMPDSVDQEGAP